MVKFEYDVANDIALIYFTDTDKPMVGYEQVDLGHHSGEVILDFDDFGFLVRIKILSANSILRQSLLYGQDQISFEAEPKTDTGYLTLAKLGAREFGDTVSWADESDFELSFDFDKNNYLAGIDFTGLSKLILDQALAR